ncbi:hypothetical protein SLA2020_176690 [Shorea laevis]
MANPRRNSYSNENQFQTQTSSSLSFLTHFLKKPQALPFLFSRLLLLTWLFLKLQPSSPSHGFLRTHEKWSQDNDLKANLVRFKAGFPFSITRDKRGWLLNPITLALNFGVKGGAVSCASVHLGEIRPDMTINYNNSSTNFNVWKDL